MQDFIAILVALAAAALLLIRLTGTISGRRGCSCASSPPGPSQGNGGNATGSCGRRGTHGVTYRPLVTLTAPNSPSNDAPETHT